MALWRERPRAWRGLWMQGAVAAAYVALRVFWRTARRKSPGSMPPATRIGLRSSGLTSPSTWPATRVGGRRRSRPVGMLLARRLSRRDLRNRAPRRGDGPHVTGFKSGGPCSSCPAGSCSACSRRCFCQTMRTATSLTYSLPAGICSVGLARAYRHPPAGPATGERAAGRRRGRCHRIVVGGALPTGSRRPRCAVLRRVGQPGAARRSGAAGARCPSGARPARCRAV